MVEGNFVEQQFLPDGATDARFWHPQENASENKLHERMKQLWGERFEE
jgi:putative ATPase